MGEQRLRRTTEVAVAVAAAMLIFSTFGSEGPTAEAAKKKQKVEGLDSAIVACPSSVGRYKLDGVGARPGDQTCTYDHPKKPGWVILSVEWDVDEHGHRGKCESRQNELIRDEDHPRPLWRLQSPTRRVGGRAHMDDRTKVSVADVESQLRKLIAATEPLAHRCVPVAPTEPGESVSCPLVLPSDLVRTDWYRGEAPAVQALSDGRFLFKCTYVPAYSEEGGAMAVELEWKGGDPGSIDLCNAGVDEYYSDTKHRLGYHPVSVRINNELVERWGGQALADALVAAASSLTQRCPDAPEGPAPYEVESAEPASTATTTTTTIVLSGGPGEEPPSLGATVPMPADDQHQIVIGGLDGEVIREEFIGDQAEVIGYGPMATDPDGNWSVSVDVEASTAPTPAPASPLPPAASPSALPSEAPSPVPAPSEDPSSPPTPSSLPVPSATPSVVPPLEPSPTPAPTPEPALSPTPVPPPEMIGMPQALADYVAGLEPEAAGVVRDLTDYLGWLGDDLVVTGKGEVTIPASAISALRVLAPDLVDEIELVPGGIVVDSYLDVRVTPVIGKDGLIEFRTNRMQETIRSHAIVKALVLALNNYVVESGGRFRTISVTPEGLTVTAERVSPE